MTRRREEAGTEEKRIDRRTQDALAALLEMAQFLALPAADEAAAPATAQRLAELIRRVLHCARAGIVAYVADTGVLQPVAAVGLTPDQEAHWRTVMRGARPADFLADPALAERVRTEGAAVLRGADLREVAAPFRVASLLVVPFGSSGHMSGLLMLDHADVPHAYTTDELALARAVATLVSFVLEREHLLREQAEAQALRATKQRVDEFLGVASHELRSPLTSIRGVIQLVRRRLRSLAAEEETPGEGIAATLAPLLDLLDRANAQIGRMNRLVEDLLDVSRLDTGHLELHRTGADLGGLVRATVEESVESYPSRAILLDLPDEPIPVQIDADRIAQVVTNYVTNAIKYSPPDRPVRVSVTRDAARAWVYVQDQGPGLTREQQARVWERYGRIAGVDVQDPATHTGGGLGLGLYISRTLIERHGGQIGVESAPGVGSTFFFSLPLAQ